MVAQQGLAEALNCTELDPLRARASGAPVFAGVRHVRRAVIDVRRYVMRVVSAG